MGWSYNGPKPAYEAVADDLAARIAAGEFPPGSRLPSRREIGEHYGIAHATTTRAVQVLINRGLAIGQSGSGTYVRQLPEVRRITRTPWRKTGEGSPWAADARRAGLIGSWDAVTDFRIPAPEPVAVRLGVDPGAPCTRTEYVFTAQTDPRAEHQPIMLSTSWEPHEITGTTAVIAPEAGPYAGRGVRERMAAIGVDIVRAVEITGARPVREDEARRLEVPPSIWLVTIQRTYIGLVDGVERPVETADLRYPADRYEVMYDIPMEPRPG